MKRKILTLVIAFIFTLTQMSFLSGVKAKAETGVSDSEIVVLGPNGQLVKGYTNKTNALEGLSEVIEKNGYSLVDNNNDGFIDGIKSKSNPQDETLMNKMIGTDWYGWMYTVNRNEDYDAASSWTGIKDFTLKAGDRLIFYYSYYGVLGSTMLANKIEFSKKVPNTKINITLKNLDSWSGKETILSFAEARIDGKAVDTVNGNITLENGLTEGIHTLEISDWVDNNGVPKVVADKFKFEIKYPQRVRIEGLNGTIVEDGAEGVNALDAVEKVLDRHGIEYKVNSSSYGDYISSIAGISAGKLGGYDGWLYYVKTLKSVISPQVTLSKYVVNEGETIVVYYGDSLTPFVNNINFIPINSEIVKENEAFKIRFTYKYLDWNSNSEIVKPIKSAIVNIDNLNYITDDNGEITSNGLSNGTHAYKISGYNIDRLPTVVMDKGVFIIDNIHNPSMNFEDFRYDDLYNSDNSVIKKDIEKEINSTLNYIKNNSKDSWAAISLNKFGLKADEDFIKNSAVEIKTYGIKDYLNTDIEKLIIALTANGYTPYDFMGYNLVSELFNRNIDDFLINDAMFGLIAYKYSNIDENYKVSREKLVDYILSKAIKYKSGENEIFGWALSGDKINPDITGGVINALSEYYDSRSDVKSAVDKAVKSLSLLQTQSGYLADNYGMFSESLSFTILGLTSIGVNPEGVDFTKIKGDLVSGLLSFKGTDGQFRHAIDGGNNYIATEQALRALIAVKEYKKLGKYDFFKSGIVSKNLAVYDLKIENTISDKSVTVKNNKSQINHLQDALERIVSQVADKENQIVGNAENNVLKTAQEATVNNTIRVDESKVANKNLNIKTVVIGSGMALAGLALIIYLLRNKKEAMK